jgi:hypothetical protein
VSLRGRKRPNSMRRKEVISLRENLSSRVSWRADCRRFTSFAALETPAVDAHLRRRSWNGGQALTMAGSGATSAAKSFGTQIRSGE